MDILSLQKVKFFLKGLEEDEGEIIRQTLSEIQSLIRSLEPDEEMEQRISTFVEEILESSESARDASIDLDQLKEAISGILEGQGPQQTPPPASSVGDGSLINIVKWFDDHGINIPQNQRNDLVTILYQLDELVEDDPSRREKIIGEITQALNNYLTDKNVDRLIKAANRLLKALRKKPDAARVEAPEQKRFRLPRISLGVNFRDIFHSFSDWPRGRKIILTVVALVLLAGLMAGGYFIYSQLFQPSRVIPEEEVVVEPPLIEIGEIPSEKIPPEAPVIGGELPPEIPEDSDKSEVTLPELIKPPAPAETVDPGSLVVYDSPQWLVWIYLSLLIMQLVADTLQSVADTRKSKQEAIRSLLAFLITTVWMTFVFFSKTEDITTARWIVLSTILITLVLKDNDLSYPAVGWAILVIGYLILSDKSQGIFLEFWGIKATDPGLFNLKDTFGLMTYKMYGEAWYSILSYLILSISVILILRDSLTRIPKLIRREEELQPNIAGFAYGIVGGVSVIFVTILKPVWWAYLVMVAVLAIGAAVVAVIDREHFDEGLAAMAILGAMANMAFAQPVLTF